MVTKITKTVYIDSQNIEHDCELDAELSDTRASLRNHFERSKVSASEKYFNAMIKELTDEHVYAISNYIDVVIRMREQKRDGELKSNES